VISSQQEERRSKSSPTRSYVTQVNFPSQYQDYLILLIGELSNGQVASTSAGSLGAKYIFHAHSPFYTNSNAAAAMDLIVKNCLKKASIVQCSSIAIPYMDKFGDYSKVNTY